MTTTWREVRAARPPDVDRLRGYRIKADILREIERARSTRVASELWREGPRYHAYDFVAAGLWMKWTMTEKVAGD